MKVYYESIVTRIIKLHTEYREKYKVIPNILELTQEEYNELVLDLSYDVVLAGEVPYNENISYLGMKIRIKTVTNVKEQV